MIQTPFSTSGVFSSPVSPPTPSLFLRVWQRSAENVFLCEVFVQHYINSAYQINTILRMTLHFPLTLIWGFRSLRCKWLLNSGPQTSLLLSPMINLHGFQEASCENNALKPETKGTGGFCRKHNIKASFAEDEGWELKKKKKKQSLGGFCFFFQSDLRWHIVTFICFLTLRGWQIAVSFWISIVTLEVLCRVGRTVLNNFSWTSGSFTLATNDSSRRNDI